MGESGGAGIKTKKRQWEIMTRKKHKNYCGDGP